MGSLRGVEYGYQKKSLRAGGEVKKWRLVGQEAGMLEVRS